MDGEEKLLQVNANGKLSILNTWDQMHKANSQKSLEKDDGWRIIVSESSRKEGWSR